MILGHITNTYVIGDTLKRFKIRINLPFFIFGAILPDLIDKPLSTAYILSGRGITHSLIIQFLIVYLTIRCFNKKRTSSILTVWAGCLLHLLQDWPDIKIIFWPLLGMWDIETPISIFQKFYIYYILDRGSIRWWIEIISIAYVMIRTNFIIRRYREIAVSHIPNPAEPEITNCKHQITNKSQYSTFKWPT